MGSRLRLPGLAVIFTILLLAACEADTRPSADAWDLGTCSSSASASNCPPDGSDTPATRDTANGDDTAAPRDTAARDTAARDTARDSSPAPDADATGPDTRDTRVDTRPEPDTRDSCVPEQFSDLSIHEDRDDDGIPDEHDNCPTRENPEQRDSDDNGIGDACSDGVSSDCRRCVPEGEPCSSELDCCTGSCSSDGEVCEHEPHPVPAPCREDGQCASHACATMVEEPYDVGICVGP